MNYKEITMSGLFHRNCELAQIDIIPLFLKHLGVTIRRAEWEARKAQLLDRFDVAGDLCTGPVQF